MEALWYVEYPLELEERLREAGEPVLVILRTELTQVHLAELQALLYLEVFSRFNVRYNDVVY